MVERCHVLMVFPRFNANSFWNYEATCEMTGARYPAAPLGLITVAAMLPTSWEVKLVNRMSGVRTCETRRLGVWPGRPPGFVRQVRRGACDGCRGAGSRRGWD